MPGYLSFFALWGRSGNGRPAGDWLRLDQSEGNLAHPDRYRPLERHHKRGNMNCRITKSFTLDAAHWLPEVPEGHKCGRLHGHTYTIILGLEGALDTRMGWVQDYGEVSRAFAPVLDMLDHHCLN